MDRHLWDSRSACLWAVAVALWLGATDASAQAEQQPGTGDAAEPAGGGEVTQDQAMAEALFQRGLEAMDDRRLEAGCELMEQSLRLDVAPGTLWHLSQCREGLGHIASAWAAARQLATLSERLDQPRRADVARQRAEALEPRLSRIFVVVKGESLLNDLEVLLDERELNAASWNVGLPIDQGEHELMARAPGRLPWRHSFTVAEERSMARIRVPVLDLAPADMSPSTPWFERPAGWVLGGGAVVFLAVSVGFLVNSLELDSDASAPGLDLQDRDRLGSKADKRRLVSYIGMGLTGVSAAGAALVWTDVF